MRKYKILLTGNNTIAISDFFDHMNDAFEAMTTSLRFNDMMNHLNIFQPEIFVFCLNAQSADDYSKLKMLQTALEKMDVVKVIVGSEEDCEDFKRTHVYEPELVLQKPITDTMIKEKIVGYMEQRQAQMEEQQRLLEQKQEEERQEQQRQLELQEKARRKHILVVDDDLVILKLIKEHLHEKYDVATAISGKIAHKFLETKKTDLILLDYVMPEENGPEVLKKLREKPELADIPVVFLTGISEKEKIQQALALSPQGYLLKPIDKEKLLKTIEQLIG